MKKQIVLACFVLGMLCTTAWAKICPSCHAELPAKANFCLTCGLQQPVTQAAPENRPTPPKPQPSMGAQPPVESDIDWRKHPVASPAKKTAQDNKDNLFRVFASVDTFEKAIKSGAYSNIVGGFPEFKVTYGNSLRKFNQARSYLPEEVQILGQMYIEKAQACEGIVTALNSMRMDSPFRDALMLFYGQELAWYNKALQKARHLMVFTPEDVANLKLQSELIATRCKKYEITAKFLRIGKENVPSGTSFAVLEIRKDKAMVLVLCETPSEEPVQGWIPLNSLRGRTTWTAKSEAAFLKSPFSD